MEDSVVVKLIIDQYEGENRLFYSNLRKILQNGKLANTGKILILPVDQGFEHGPDVSFGINPLAFDPHYHFHLAQRLGFNAFAAPLGVLEAGCETFKGKIPMILKLNSSNALRDKDSTKDQAITSTVRDAIRLGCCGVGFTLYPGSNKFDEMLEELREIRIQAKEEGLVLVVWSYPRGEGISKTDETSMDAIQYGAHIAALSGAHIIKTKIPDAKSNISPESIDNPYYHTISTSTIISDNKLFPKLRDNINNCDKLIHSLDYTKLQDRITGVKLACLGGRRLVIFSGGTKREEDTIINDAIAIKNGYGDGMIVGRNIFQRPFGDAEQLVHNLVQNLV